LEELLSGIWCELLHVERVGRQDNFFELGGHSLLIVQMIERLRQRGLGAEIRSVFESATLAELAATLGKSQWVEYAVPPNLIPADCKQITSAMLPLIELDQEHIDAVVSTVPGGAANVQDIYPLAPLQEGILFHHLLNEHGADTYVLPMLLALPSHEQLQRLIEALQAVIDRHDILRTAVLWEGQPRPVQVVYRKARLPVQELELDPSRDALEQMRERMVPQLQRVELRSAPLMRLQIAQGEGAQWYALLQLHHLMTDHVAQEIFVEEVTAHLQGRAEHLPSPVAFRGFVAQALRHAHDGDAEAFFRRKLSDVEESTAPFGLVDVHGDGSQIEEVRQVLEPRLCERVRLVARALSMSPAPLFHAAWGLVVARTSGRDDVVFGSVLSGRLQGTAGADRVLGMFINTLPLRLQMKGATVRAMVRQTQRELVELLKYEQASLAQAQRCSGIVGRAPLFSAVLNYRYSVAARTEPGGHDHNEVQIQVLAAQERTNYPLTLSIDDLGERFRLVAQVDRRIDARRVLGYVHTALEGLVEALESTPDRMLLDLPMLPETEHQQVIEAFNATHRLYPQEALIHELFEAQVEKTPDAVAVIYEDQQVRYSELNRRANQLAHCLRAYGIGPDQLVGICVGRSLELVVGILGVLKAGGAYISLDPSYPRERLALMLREAEPLVMLTDQAGRAVLPQPLDLPILDVHEQYRNDEPAGNPERRAGFGAKRLAYVIYTSGSSGTPKGVMVEHRSVVNFLCSMQRAPGIHAQDRVLALTSLSFDIAALELYLPLINGARLILGSREDASDGQRIRALLEQHRITMLQGTPSMWQLLLASGWTGQPELTALSGGEALPRQLSQQIASRVLRLWNLYGPTETTIWSTAALVDAKSLDGQFVERIGRPIDNTSIYILDERGEPVPVGVRGEIYIGGAGVARGYLKQPELTAERFLRDPFSDEPAARMYRTGDMGRWRASGDIEYLGRTDTQVKVRGYRIELGEIESRLSRHAQVKEVVVLAREDAPGEKRLVAYVTSREFPPSIDELRTHLKGSLPEYMMPAAFVLLESLPLTANGKLDRRVLPVPEDSAYALKPYEAPQGEIEELLAGIWCELLHVERVGRHDNFFDLGGHSLLSVQLPERIRQSLGREVALRELFEFSTLQTLARQLSNRGRDESVTE